MVYHWKGYGSDRTNLLEVNSATPKLYNPHFPLKKLKKVNSIAFSNEVGLITSIHDGIRFNALDMNSKNLNEVHYLSPIADFSSLIQKADGSFERIMVTKEIYRYNVEGFITEKVFNDGSKITYEYGENNKLLNIHIPGGGAWSFTYEGRGYVESIQDPAGRVTSLRIDNNGDLILITDPRLEMKRYGYDSSHLMVSKFDERGLESNYNYVLGRVNKATYPGGREKFINNTLVNFSQNQLKMAEVPRLPSKDVLTQYVLPGGPKKEVIIDHFGAFRGIVDGRGKTRFVERNENSQPIEEISPAGRKITRSFDLLGRTNSLLDEKGNQNFEYDSVTQKVSSVTDAFGHSKLYSYRPNGQISSYTDKRGMTTYVAYNENNLINNVTDPLNNTTFINRDGSGNISSVVDPLGHGISIERDAAGNPISKSFPEGGADLFEYDEASLLTKITDAVGGSTHISYSPTGKIESIINANNQSTSFLYNEQELISTVINPKGQIENYSYDLDGELIQKVTKSGAAINYILDENKNLISKTFPDEVVSMEYDDDNLLVKATDSDSSFEKRYDNFKRVTEEYQSLSNSYVKYNYSARGLKSKTKLVVDGKVLMDIDHFYDPTGNKSRIIARVSGKSVKVDRNFDEAGRVVGINFPNGGTSSITYDKKSQIKTILSFGTFGSFQSYRYTPNGNVSQYIDKFNSLPKVNRFDYDPANRLVREDSTSLKVYNLDALGNDSSNGGAFNELNQLIQDNNFNYQYDLNGNLSKKTSRFQQKDFAYTWNAENQLLSVQVIETPSQFVLKSLSYKYDPSGRRIERVVIDHKDSSKSYTQRFVYDGDNILAILDGNNEFIIGYIHGQGVDDPLVMVTDYDKDGHLNVLSVIKDMQKSIKVLMDEEMKPVQEITYSAYGEPTIKNIGQGLKVTNNNMLFTSREYEPETGEYYYRARYYDPKAGRFLSEDPIGFQGGDYNLYRYVNNNPIKFTDPSGEQYLYKCDDEDTLSCVFLRVIEEKIIEEIMPKPPKPEPPRPPVSTCNPEVQSCKNEPIKEILDPPKDPGSCE